MTSLGHVPSWPLQGPGAAGFEAKEGACVASRLTFGAGDAQDTGIKAVGERCERPYVTLHTLPLGVGAPAGFSNVLACVRGGVLWSDPTRPWGLASPSSQYQCLGLGAWG